MLPLNHIYRKCSQLLLCPRYCGIFIRSCSQHHKVKCHQLKMLKKESAICCTHRNPSKSMVRWKTTTSKKPNSSYLSKQDFKGGEKAKPLSVIAELSLEDISGIFGDSEVDNGKDSVDIENSEDQMQEELLYPHLEELLASSSSGKVDLALELGHDLFNSPYILREKLSNSVKDRYDLFSGPEPSVPMSDVPCPGCGALLHCQDPGIPGYMPSQRFLDVLPKKLRDNFCQRCLLMKEHNFALNLSVPPEKYKEIISQVRNEFALVLVMVDVMDLPNSIFPNLSELIGRNRPLYVVGNKVDQLPRDDKGYLERTKDYLLRMCDETGLTTDNPVKHTCLISAKTGYGVEELVTKLMKDWAKKGHVFILGCTNVGKSSLFNMLLSSDYCKATARHFIHRATTSAWPGTTLNLLKFPIVNPSPWRLQLRAKRLLKQRSAEVEEERLRQHKEKTAGKVQNATLWGHIGQTFVDSTARTPGLRHVDKQANIASYTFRGSGFREDLERSADRIVEFDETLYAKGHWCYDTPGVVNEQQIINRLTQEELAILLTGTVIQPRSFAVKPGYVMFVSGLGRIDYVKGLKTICLTLVASKKIPVHVMKYEDADDFYSHNIGTDNLKLPLGGQERLNRLPSLVGKEFNLTGIGLRESIADLLLSSLGWVAVTAHSGLNVTLRAYTPGGIGCGLRKPPLLPYAVNLKGRRIRGTPEYQIHRADT